MKIYCPACSAPDEIELDLLWKKGPASARFVFWPCSALGCKKRKRASLGKWLRFANDSSSDISSWLKDTQTFDCEERPLAVTNKMFTQREIVQLNIHKKRKTAAYEDDCREVGVSECMRMKLLDMEEEPPLGCKNCRSKPHGCKKCYQFREQWRKVHQSVETKTSLVSSTIIISDVLRKRLLQEPEPRLGCRRCTNGCKSCRLRLAQWQKVHNTSSADAVQADS